MKKVISIKIKMLSLLAVMVLTATHGIAADKTFFKAVELDAYIDTEKVQIKDKKLIKTLTPISFEAAVKRLPEKREMSYVYTALELAGFNPMPGVEHRMFVESGDGRVIAVYVEKGVVKKIDTLLNVDERALFFGYHLYSYNKGPAIMVVDFTSFKKHP